MRSEIVWIVRANSNQFRTFVKSKGSPDSIKLLQTLRTGKSLAEIWNPISLELYIGNPGESGEESEDRKPVPDLARGVIGICVNAKARSILEPLIANRVNFLTLNTEVGAYYEMDVQQIDCLDASKSIHKLLPSGKVLRVEKYSFHWDRLEDVHIFIIPELGRNPVFVSNRFRDIVERNRLKGLSYYPVPLV